MRAGVVYEDEDLLVANKPAGLNTHAPSPYAGEGLYEWLRDREPRWAELAIIHRLDKETSGLIVFSKSTRANRSLTAQFTARSVRKKYLLLTHTRPPRTEFTARSHLRRAGGKYLSARAGGELAETRFLLLPSAPAAECVWVQAEPLTGRTHQIRVQAAENGFPIMGDALYGGRPAARVCLHAAEISFQHPATGNQVVFTAPVDFAADPRLALRAAILDPEQTNTCRVIHGASDGWPGWQVDRLGDWLLSQSEQAPVERQLAELDRLGKALGSRGAYHKRLTRNLRKSSVTESSPQLIFGDPAPERFTVRENGIRYELSFREGYSVGLFLDQRDNRWRLMTGHVAAGFDLAYPGQNFRDRQDACPTVLNTFAYTGAFSVCAALLGGRATSLDLSKKYLEWGRRNFTLNHLDPAGHEFIFGDVFDWLKRLRKKGRRFNLVLLDPPTFSQSKEHGPFRVERDYGELVAGALWLLIPGGVLFASSNAAGWAAEDFLDVVRGSVQQAGRKVEQDHYSPQPIDFPISRGEPGYLKTVWLRIS